MELTQSEIFRLKKLLKQLARYRGRHTELVTVYIPAGYDLNKIINHLFQEQGTATNIKSASTRKNVIDALVRMQEHLKQFKKTPENGLAVFSGNISEKEGASDVEVWSIIPPSPLNQRIYRCDKTFVLEPIQNMLISDECYGLVVLDRRDAMLGILKGKAIIPLAKTHSEVPGKHKTGGQSAQRFERLREGATLAHFKKIAQMMIDEFLFLKGLKGILVGGPGITVTSFLNKAGLNQDLLNKIIGKFDLSYTGRFGLDELVDKAEDVLAKEELMQEKKYMQQFFQRLLKKPDMVTYGKQHCEKALEQNAVDVLLISASTDEDTIEKLDEDCKNFGTTLFIVSTESREGVQLKDMGGFACLLRYPVSLD